MMPGGWTIIVRNKLRSPTRQTMGQAGRARRLLRMSDQAAAFIQFLGTAQRDGPPAFAWG
jgi:hypothetical protein